MEQQKVWDPLRKKAVALTPEEKVRHSPDSDYYRCYDVVTGCAESLRALFWDKNWGGTIPRPTPIPEGT